jgi:hypothetical protein
MVILDGVHLLQRQPVRDREPQNDSRQQNTRNHGVLLHGKNDAIGLTAVAVRADEMPMLPDEERSLPGSGFPQGLQYPRPDSPSYRRSRPGWRRHLFAPGRARAGMPEFKQGSEIVSG